MSKSALQAGMTVDISRKLENILGQLGASGKGLHEKATSVQHLLPAKLLSKLRYVASVRNKLSHDDVVLADAEFNQFVTSARATLEELGQLAMQPRPQAAARPMERSAPARSGAGKWLLPGAVVLGLLVYLSSGGKPAAPVASVVTPEPAAALAPAPAPTPAPAFQQSAPRPVAPVAKTQREPRAASAHRSAPATAAHEAPASAAAPTASFETIRDLTKGL